MVGLLSALPKTQLYYRLAREGRLNESGSGNNTEASINLIPILERDYLISGYRSLMQSLYQPAICYQRILTFLAHHGGRPPERFRLSWRELRAFFLSLWYLGVWQNGRLDFWKFITSALRRHPRQFANVMTLAIQGVHFRQVSKTL